MLKFLPSLRLPTRSEACVAGAALLILLFASWQRRGEKISALEAQLAAKPMVEERVKEVRVEGPVRVVEKFVVGPAGACVLDERTTERGATTTTTEAEHEERPICAPEYSAHTRYAGLALDPLDARRPRLRAGVTLFDRLDLGGAYDTRFPPLGGALQAEAAYRF